MSPTNGSITDWFSKAKEETPALVAPGQRSKPIPAILPRMAIKSMTAQIEVLPTTIPAMLGLSTKAKTPPPPLNTPITPAVALWTKEQEAR